MKLVRNAYAVRMDGEGVCVTVIAGRWESLKAEVVGIQQVGVCHGDRVVSVG